ncbi:hypothetical protein ALC56_14473 [Trachymyrmex septentrionalis]|uniref:Uncharacterized protein n=1 Tax=Trachymyrmex septentrionalis TaxID=34720 RepID=A0A195ESI1_9HYME|nr:hypothetical protein ALC56_14473 [Trachymyrmex septentrionalis]
MKVEERNETHLKGEGFISDNTRGRGSSNNENNPMEERKRPIERTVQRERRRKENPVSRIKDFRKRKEAREKNTTERVTKGRHWATSESAAAKAGKQTEREEGRVELDARARKQEREREREKEREDEKTRKKNTPTR